MTLRGYDRWKTTEPEPYDDRPVCSWCGGPMDKSRWQAIDYWRCEKCGTEDDEDPVPETEYEYQDREP